MLSASTTRNVDEVASMNVFSKLSGYLSDVSSVDSAEDEVTQHDHDIDDHHHETDNDWENADLDIPGDTQIDREVPVEETPSAIVEETPLQNVWTYYYHLPNDKNWNVDSYVTISKDIKTVETLIAVNETVTDHIIKNCMLFVMKRGIKPMWEDPQNRNGGCFSYKVINKTVCQVWRKLMYLLCGNSLTVDPKHSEMVNGITISPKKGFCIVKIWLSSCKLQDPTIITTIDGLMKNGCLFKAHSPEF
jgi:Eukaryotic initiation factor 4E